MKLAVLIGVSDYTSQQNLSASKNDVALIKSMIDLSGEYSNILYIDNDTNTRQVKNKLSEFIENNTGKEIDELLFYFSGHGFFNGSEFHYILSDFDSNKIKSTSLENSELDIMMKSLNPKLTIKIVDACNSGVSYIKDPGALSKHIDESKIGFSKCYFMFSSEDAQSSFADAHLSFFTKAIGEAVAYSVENSIRYKDIIDYISDKFSRNENQSPVFVNQASFTEVFIKSINQESKKLIESSLSVASDSVIKINKKPLKDLVIEDAKRYFTEDKAMEIYESLPKLVEKEFKFKGEIKDLFDLTIEPSDKYEEIPKLSLLAEWVKKNNDDLFVNAKEERKERQVRRPKNRTVASTLSRLNMSIWGDDEDDDKNYKWVTEYYYQPVSIESLLNCSYKVISVFSKSKHPNINSARLYLLPLLSKTKLVILSCTASYKPSGWDSEILIDSNIKWTPHTLELISKNELGKYLGLLAINFEDEISNTILKSFNLLQDSKDK
ncbi:caspase family protein [Dickeya undicola]|uniref:caspase family protein n=1 Tax=Dickeya undicola TaxID=1577887 RepID=UPI003F239EBA